MGKLTLLKQLDKSYLYINKSKEKLADRLCKNYIEGKVDSKTFNKLISSEKYTYIESKEHKL